MDIYPLVQQVSSVDTQTLLAIFKIMFLIIDLYMIGFIVNALMKTTWLKRLFLWDLDEYLHYKHFDMGKIAKKWNAIKERLDVGSMDEAKLAVIEADNLLDEVLTTMGYKGETLGEKLNELNVETLANLPELKNVHSARSGIVHDPSYHLSLEQANDFLAVYEKALDNLGAI